MIGDLNGRDSPKRRVEDADADADGVLRRGVAERTRADALTCMSPDMSEVLPGVSERKLPSSQGEDVVEEEHLEDDGVLSILAFVSSDCLVSLA